MLGLSFKVTESVWSPQPPWGYRELGLWKGKFTVLQGSKTD